MSANNVIRIAGIVEESIVDGPGLRFVIFMQGCKRNCPGCHNPGTHDENGGYLVGIDWIMDKVRANPLLDGVTFSGGEPMLQHDRLLPLAKRIKESGLDLVMYTGYIYEEIMDRELVGLCDIVIDGMFDAEKKTLAIPFVGSSNQRVIYMATK